VKIAIVISNFEYGGAQQQIVAFANSVGASEHEINIISLSDFVPLAESLTAWSDRLHIVKKRWKYDLTIPLRLYWLLRRLDVDILHAFLFDAELASRIAGRLAGVPVIVGSERNCDYKLKPIRQRFYNLTKSMQDWCVANSHAGAQFRRELLGYDDGQFAVVHNGVDIKRFKPADATMLRRSLGIAETDLVVGVFASFKAQKNHELFFRAIAQIIAAYSNLKLMLVGEELFGGMHGSAEHARMIQALVDQLGLREKCIFVGNKRNVEDYYPACDLTVLPSRHEGMPNVILESLACGVPVVATRVADNEILVPDGKVGFIVESEDAVGLATRIRELLDDSVLREKLGATARSWIVENFSADRMAEKMIAAYRMMYESAERE
jgi:glycosyltransferase involved in cell wall biosynthesis